MSDSTLQSPDVKRCSKCGEVKPLHLFEPRKESPSGYRNCCVSCIRAAQRDRYHNPRPPKPTYPEGLKRCSKCRAIKPLEMFVVCRDRSGGYSGTCKTCHRIACESWTDRNRERIAKRSKERRIANREYYREQGRIQRVKHADKRRAYDLANPEKKAIRQHRYGQKHPDRLSVLVHQRRARLRAIGGRFTHKDIAHMCAIQQGHCAYCGRLDQRLTIEHIIPTTRPGSSNDPWNLCLTCGKCNSSKGDKLLEEWTDRWYLQ